MTPKEKKCFIEFKNEIIKYNSINTNDLWMILRRHIKGNMGRRFFNSNLKERYYKFWIKILVNQKIIRLKNNCNWEVIK
ncbi:MAG: hypothetical protein ACTSUC_09720 [Promethearchaeota archaeon]